MTEKRLQEIEARANAATEGPWEEVRLPVGSRTIGDGLVEGIRMGAATFFIYRETDQKFIAHAREDVPRLVQEVRNTRCTAMSFQQQLLNNEESYRRVVHAYLQRIKELEAQIRRLESEALHK